jgi:hypothetical protein
VTMFYAYRPQMQHVYQLLLPSRTKAANSPHFAQVLFETRGRSWRGTTRRSLGGVGSSSTSQSLAVIATVPPPFGSSRVYPQTRQFSLSRAGAHDSPRKQRSDNPVAKRLTSTSRRTAARPTPRAKAAPSTA